MSSFHALCPQVREQSVCFYDASSCSTLKSKADLGARSGAEISLHAVSVHTHSVASLSRAACLSANNLLYPHSMNCTFLKRLPTSAPLNYQWIFCIYEIFVKITSDFYGSRFLKNIFS